MIKHAYLIIAHNNFWQLTILLRLLDDIRNDIFLFIDKKNIEKADQNNIRASVSRSHMSIFSPFEINWGGYSQCRAELFLMKKAKEKDNYRYYHLLSGVDLPLHNQNYIHDFFQQHDGYEFLAFVGKEISEKVKPEERMKYYYLFSDINITNKLLKKAFHFLNRILLFVQRKVGINRIKKERLIIGYGTNWFSITCELVDYILSKKVDIERLFSKSFCCDEVFIHTLILNSPFKDRIFTTDGLRDCREDRQGSLRYINWWDGNPKTWTIKDKQEILEAKERGYLFTRKFDEKQDKEIIRIVANMVENEGEYTVTDAL